MGRQGTKTKNLRRKDFLHLELKWGFLSQSVSLYRAARVWYPLSTVVLAGLEVCELAPSDSPQSQHVLSSSGKVGDPSIRRLTVHRRGPDCTPGSLL
jgi:hypothetical protein